MYTNADSEQHYSVVYFAAFKALYLVKDRADMSYVDMSSIDVSIQCIPRPLQ